MSNSQVRDVLPPIVEKVALHRAPGRVAVRPDARQHRGDRRRRKTRHLDRIIDEVDGFFDVHAELGTHPGGLHVELTGDDVTECIGGTAELTAADLAGGTRPPATRG